MRKSKHKRGGLLLSRGKSRAANAQVRDLQRDLRQLGYLRVGVNGDFGPVTERAVKGPQYDLLRNDARAGETTGMLQHGSWITTGEGWWL